MNGQILYDSVVVKPGKLPQFYVDAPRVVLPDNIHSYDDAYTYGFVPGRRAELQDVNNILKACEQQLWRVCHWAGEVDRSVRERYATYVHDVSTGCVPKYYELLIIDALDIILSAKLPLAFVVHGDLTLENVIIRTAGYVTFIDPGDTREVNTPALDRGKLLQSIVMRWESRVDGESTRAGQQPWEEPNPWPAWASIVDWAFLVTHWARLQRHWPGWNTGSAWPALARLRP